MFKSFVAIWFTFYQQKTGEQYVFDAKDGRHLKQLIKKVETKVRQKGFEPSEENITATFMGFLEEIKDPWILDNLEVAIVNSKFNVLYARAIRTNPFTQRNRTDDIIERRHSQGAK